MHVLTKEYTKEIARAKFYEGNLMGFIVSFKSYAQRISGISCTVDLFGFRFFINAYTCSTTLMPSSEHANDVYCCMCVEARPHNASLYLSKPSAFIILLRDLADSHTSTAPFSARHRRLPSLSSSKSRSVMSTEAEVRALMICRHEATPREGGLAWPGVKPSLCGRAVRCSSPDLNAPI